MGALTLAYLMTETPKLVELLNLEWSDADGTYQVIDSMHDNTLGWGLVVSTPDGEHEFMDVREAVRAAGAALGNQAQSKEWLDDLDRWEGVSIEQKERAIRRSKDLAEMRTGDPLGDVLTDVADPQRINPRYDPRPKADPTDTLTEGQRVARKSEELKRRGEKDCGESTLRNQLRRLKQPGGVRNLVHGRTGKKYPRNASTPVEALAADVRAFAESRLDENSVSLDGLESSYRASRRDSELLSTAGEGEITRLIREESRRLQLHKAATLRRSQSTRDPRASGFWEVNRPFECVQLDSTPLDVFAIDANGEVINRVHFVTAIDAYSSRIVAYALVPTGKGRAVSAQVIKRILWDTVANNYFGSGPHSNLLGATPILARRIYIAVIDRGGEFNSFDTLGQLAGIGTHTVIAPPGMGIRKPHEEAFYKSLALVAQKLPGAKGANIQERGRHPERGPMLRLDHLHQILGVLLATHAHTPRRDHRWNPDYPNMKMSPMQREEQYFRTNPSLELDPVPHRALELLDVQRRAIINGRITIGPRQYHSPLLHTIAESLPRSTRDSNPRITVYIDKTRPQAVIVRGIDGIPLVVADPKATKPEPILADVLDRDLREQLMAGPVPAVDIKSINQRITDLAHDLAVVPAPHQDQPPSLTSQLEKKTKREKVSESVDLEHRYGAVLAAESETESET